MDTVYQSTPTAQNDLMPNSHKQTKISYTKEKTAIADTENMQLTPGYLGEE